MAFPLKHVRAYTLPVLGNTSLRIAQLTVSCVFESAELFLPAAWPSLEQWGPHSLIASASDLDRLTRRLDLGTLRLPTLDHSIYVLTGVGDEPLSDQQRNQLWERFGVPVYELFLGQDHVLAFECEAHAGWHLEPGTPFTFLDGQLLFTDSRSHSVRTGLWRRVETQPCSCGRPGARLVATGEQPAESLLPHLDAAA